MKGVRTDFERKFLKFVRPGTSPKMEKNLSHIRSPRSWVRNLKVKSHRIDPFQQFGIDVWEKFIERKQIFSRQKISFFHLTGFSLQIDAPVERLFNLKLIPKSREEATIWKKSKMNAPENFQFFPQKQRLRTDKLQTLEANLCGYRMGTVRRWGWRGVGVGGFGLTILIQWVQVLFQMKTFPLLFLLFSLGF